MEPQGASLGSSGTVGHCFSHNHDSNKKHFDRAEDGEPSLYDTINELGDAFQAETFTCWVIWAMGLYAVSNRGRKFRLTRRVMSLLWN